THLCEDAGRISGHREHHGETARWPGVCAPLPQHCRDEPPREPAHVMRERCLVQVRVEESMREGYGAHRPLGPPPTPTKEAVPIEIWGPGFQGDPDVAQPQRAPRPVTQKVKTEESEVVLGTGHSDVDVVDPYDSRLRVEIVDAAVVEKAA